MCGIIGKAGNDDVIPSILDGLKKLEYRGYDSAGLAVLGESGFSSVKTAGRVADLRETVTACRCAPGNIGIGHTRWATHGAPTDTNAHPHFSPDGVFAVVHNGIIENAAELKKKELPAEENYTSGTDTEVIAHLLQKFYKGDVIAAVSQTITRLRGSFALGILCADCPDTLFAAAYASPLFAAKSADGCYIASDTGAIGENTCAVYKIENREICRLTENRIEFFTPEGQPFNKRRENVTAEKLNTDKGGYEHYMLMEIMQQPDAVRRTLAPLINGGRVTENCAFPPDDFIRDNLDNIVIAACGSAYHTGLTASQLIEKTCRLPCRAVIASEYRYADVLTDSRTLVIFISQSGETADTLAALRLAKERGAKVLSVVNVEGSAIAGESEKVIYTKAGRETAVATTKAYSAQLAVLYALTIYIAKIKGSLTDRDEKRLTDALLALPEKIGLAIRRTEQAVRELAEKLAETETMFFIGRLLDHAAAEEASLKMKEVSYINSQAYAAGELKHGTISLIEKGTPVIALATQEDVFTKTCSNLSEVKARGAYTVLVTGEKFLTREFEADAVIAVPDTEEAFACSLAVIPMQLLSYYTAKKRGCDIDKPRNLAKSVTVE